MEPLSNPNQAEARPIAPRSHAGGIKANSVVQNRTDDGVLRASEANGYSGSPSVFCRVVERLLNDSVKGGFNRGRQTLAFEPFDSDPLFGPLGHTLSQEFEGRCQAEIIQDGGP